MTEVQRFRRNLGVVTGVHVLGVALFFFTAQSRPNKPPQVMWLDGGALSAVGSAAEPEGGSTPDPEVAPDPPADPPIPEPAETSVSSPTVMAPAAPSEIVLPKSTPAPATPKPVTPQPATPKPVTPKSVTPNRATPKASASRTTPKIAPKPTPITDAKSSPKSSISPKSTPKTAIVAAAKSPETGKSKSTPPQSIRDSDDASAPSTSAAKTAGSGAVAGSGHGAGKTGGGSASGSELTWYYQMLQDRFESRWQQPTSVVRSAQEFVTTLKIRINKSGAILAREIVSSSGNAIMDESVRTAAEKVQAVDPLPAGLGGETFDININFKLDQGE